MWKCGNETLYKLKSLADNAGNLLFKQFPHLHIYIFEFIVAGI